MIIIMLAGAMTVTMLIATAFALHHEAQRARAAVSSIPRGHAEPDASRSGFGRLASTI